MVAIAGVPDDARVTQSTAREPRTTPNRHAWLVAAHVTAALLTLAYWYGLGLVFAIVSWGNSVCGTATAADVAAARKAVRGFGLLAAIVPVIVAIAFGRRRPRSAVAWLTLALVVVVVGLISAMDAQPSQWCF
jgi:FtsH-binding integral membrane protein